MLFDEFELDGLEEDGCLESDGNGLQGPGLGPRMAGKMGFCLAREDLVGSVGQKLAQEVAKTWPCLNEEEGSSSGISPVKRARTNNSELRGIH